MDEAMHTARVMRGIRRNSGGVGVNHFLDQVLDQVLDQIRPGHLNQQRGTTNKYPSLSILRFPHDLCQCIYVAPAQN